MTSENFVTTLIGVVLAVGLLIFGVILWQGNGSVLTTDYDVLETSLIVRAENFINYRAQLSAIQVDTALFSDPTFTSLTSDTPAVIPQPVGRPNMFE